MIIVNLLTILLVLSNNAIQINTKLIIPFEEISFLSSYPNKEENIKTISDFINNHLNKKFTITAYTELSPFCQEILTKVEISQKIVSSKDKNGVGSKVNKKVSNDVYDYLIFPKNFTDLLFVMKYIMKSTSWNPTNRFLIVSECTLDNNEILNVYDIIRKKHLYKCLFIQICDGSLVGYSWNFKNGTSRCDNVINLVQFNVNLESVDDYFIEKIPKENEVCSIRVLDVSQIYYNGTVSAIERLYQAIADVLRLKLIKNKPNPTYKEELYFNDSVVSVTHDLINHELDIGSIVHSTHVIKRELVEKTVPYYYLENLWLLPRRKILKNWNIFLPIRYISYFIITIIIATIVLVAILTLHSRLLKDTIKSSFLNRTIFLFSLLTTASGKLLSKSPSLRLLMYIATLYGFYLNISYSCVISSMVTNPPREPKIKTFEEFCKSDYRLSFYESFFEHLEQKGYDGVKEALKRKWKRPEHNFLTSELLKVVKEQKYGIVVHNQALKIVRNYKEEERITPFYDFAFECLLVRKGFPISKEMNKVIRGVAEGGIFEKWIDKENSPFPHVYIPDVSYEATKLQLQDLKGAFIILAAGIAISTGIFIAERITFYIINR